jgi:hypothetical protein
LTQLGQVMYAVMHKKQRPAKLNKYSLLVKSKP